MINRKKIALCALAVILLTGCTKKTPEELIASAKENIAEGSRQTAIVELKNAISQNANLAEARTLLGKVYLGMSQFDAAEKELLRAADLGAPDIDVYPPLVKVYYYQEDFNNVIATSERVLASLDENAQPAVALYKFLAELRNAQNGGEFPSIPSKLNTDQKALAEAYLAFVQGDIEEANKVTDAFSKQSDEKAEQFFLKGLIANRLSQLDVAAENFLSTLNEFPNYHLVRFLLIDVLMRDQKLEEANEQVDKLLAINKDQPQANYYKGAIAFQNKDYETSFIHAQKAREGRAEGLRNDIVHGMSAYKLGKMEQAYSSLLRAASQLPKSHSVHRLVAQLQLNLGYRQEASETLSGLEGFTEIDPVLFEEAANLFAQEGDYDIAAQQFGKVNALVDNNARAEIGEGLAKIASKDMSGVDNLKKAIELESSNDQAWLLLAEVYMDNGQQQAALDLARQWQEQNQVGGLVLEGQILSRMSDQDAAVAKFKEALVLDDSNVAAANNLIKIYRETKQHNEAMQLAMENLQSNPTNNYAARELIIVSRDTKQTDAARDFFQKLVQQNSSLEEPVLMLTSLYRVAGQNQAAIDLLEKNRSTLRTEGLMALGDAYYNAKELNKAESVYMEWRDAFPGQVTPWMRLVGIEAQRNNAQKARALLKSAIEKFPTSEPLRLANLRYMMNSKEYPAARDELERLKNAGSTNILLTKYEGQLALVSRDYQLASSLLKQYYDATKNINDAVNTSLAYVALGKKEQAKALLDSHLKGNAVSTNDKFKIAEFMLSQAYYNDAIKLYSEVLQTNPDNVVSLNNLASAYIQVGQFEQALEYAERANQIAPNLPQLMDTHGWALFKSDRTGEAEVTLAVAYSKMPESTNIALHYAEVLISLQKQQEASQVLAKLKPVNSVDQAKLKELQEKLRNLG